MQALLVAAGIPLPQQDSNLNTSELYRHYDRQCCAYGGCTRAGPAPMSHSAKLSATVPKLRLNLPELRYTLPEPVSLCHNARLVIQSELLIMVQSCPYTVAGRLLKSQPTQREFRAVQTQSECWCDADDTPLPEPT